MGFRVWSACCRVRRADHIQLEAQKHPIKWRVVCVDLEANVEGWKGNDTHVLRCDPATELKYTITETVGTTRFGFDAEALCRRRSRKSILHPFRS